MKHTRVKDLTVSERQRLNVACHLLLDADMVIIHKLFYSNSMWPFPCYLKTHILWTTVAYNLLLVMQIWKDQIKTQVLELRLLNLSPIYQGSALSLTITKYSIVDFRIPYKMMSQPGVLAERRERKNSTFYYCPPPS